MTRSEIALLLGAIAGRDQRTIGETDVLAWHEDLHDLNFADAREAVSRHFRESTDRLMPAHIRRQVRLIHDERRAHTTVEELPPGRFENDPDRDERIARNVAKVQQVVAEIVAKRSIPDDGAEQTRSDAIRQLAVERARLEKRAARLRGEP